MCLAKLPLFPNTGTELDNQEDYDFS